MSVLTIDGSCDWVWLCALIWTMPMFKHGSSLQLLIISSIATDLFQGVYTKKGGLLKDNLWDFFKKENMIKLYKERIFTYTIWSATSIFFWSLLIPTFLHLFTWDRISYIPSCPSIHYVAKDNLRPSLWVTTPSSCLCWVYGNAPSHLVYEVLGLAFYQLCYTQRPLTSKFSVLNCDLK